MERRWGKVEREGKGVVAAGEEEYMRMTDDAESAHNSLYHSRSTDIREVTCSGAKPPFGRLARPDFP